MQEGVDATDDIRVSRESHYCNLIENGSEILVWLFVKICPLDGNDEVRANFTCGEEVSRWPVQEADDHDQQRRPDRRKRDT